MHHHPVWQRGSRPSLGVSLSNGRFDCHWGMSVLTEFDGRRTFWLLRILSTPNDACFDPNTNLGLSGTIPSALSPTLKTMCVLCPRVVCVSHLFEEDRIQPLTLGDGGTRACCVTTQHHQAQLRSHRDHSHRDGSSTRLEPSVRGSPSTAPLSVPSPKPPAF